jgi:hypothetical protein
LMRFWQRSRPRKSRSAPRCEDPDYCRFAWILDPDGNRIAL